MIDRLFLATLTLSLLAGATLAIGSEFVTLTPAPIAVVRLDPVVVTGHRPVALAAARSSEAHAAQ